MNDPQYDNIRRKVEERYKQRLGLIIHLVAFFVFNLMFWGMWLIISPSSAVEVSREGIRSMPVDIGFPWPLIITLGWGVGIVAHFLTYYYRYGAGANQREEAIEREIERELIRREEAGYVEKPKNDQRMRLTEDGELEAVSDDDFSRADKNKRG